MDARHLRAGAQGVTVSTVTVVSALPTLRPVQKHSSAPMPHSHKSSTTEFHPRACPHSARWMNSPAERWSGIYVSFRDRLAARLYRGIRTRGRRFSSAVHDVRNVILP